ncbi:MAG: CBS domain-containing protein, partial [Anaerolineales bacterium]
MDLILTHEQADFDAVAALVAAHKLYPSAPAVLPRRMNRNVRAFLTLYSGELPLVHPDDRVRGRVRRVVLVDTRHMASAKGIGKRTRAHIIDHHVAEADLPEGWTQTVEPVGATTTILAEVLQERGLHLTVPEASLLLLGIYEDTGNLSYVSTTPRDIRAAAWILEQGGSLEAVNEFLSHPLTSAQRALYDELLAGVEMVVVNGHTIALATAEMGDNEEELSTLAHRLRDLLEPAALVMLVQVGADVQLVARSTTALVDVGALAQSLGGGGHGRAAAGLLPNTDVAEVRALVVEALSAIARPDKTVRELMSAGAQTLDVGMPVREAADLMQRHGHEGYPVVSDGHVVGLLTRRAVDRALTHNLRDAPVGDLMEAGTVTVTPDDSIDELQRRMIEYGWGQVPVIDGGELVGIVTRTDVIKHAGAPQHAERRNVADLLRQGLPAPALKLLHLASAAAAAEGCALYVVGGIVRDLLLGAPGLDLDLVVEGDAVAVGARLAREHGGRVTSHKRFGTAKWRLPPDLKSSAGLVTLDLASARTEFYSAPSALPEVERGSIKLDLHRRDFTINTLAIALTPERFGELLDYWGGLNDLEQRRVRVLHSLSFVDDATRMLRAARLEQRLGFTIGPRTEDLIGRALPLLQRVSGDRIRSEIELIFEEDEPERALQRLDALGVLAAIHPALSLHNRGWLATHFGAARDVCAHDATLSLPLIYLGLWLFRLSDAAAGAVAK